MDYFVDIIGTLNMVGLLWSMEDQEALGFNQNIS